MISAGLPLAACSKPGSISSGQLACSLHRVAGPLGPHPSAYLPAAACNIFWSSKAVATTCTCLKFNHGGTPPIVLNGLQALTLLPCLCLQLPAAGFEAA